MEKEFSVELNTKLKTHTKLWVKSKCTINADKDAYIYKGSTAALYLPEMYRKCTGVTFNIKTITAYSNGEIYVLPRTLTYFVPLWLFTKRSQKKVISTIKNCIETSTGKLDIDNMRVSYDRR